MKALINKNEIIAQTESLVISDPASMVIGVELLSNCNKLLDNLTKEKEKVTKPLNEALKAERARFKPLEGILESAITSIRSKMSVYQTEQVRLQRKAETNITARVEKGTLGIDKALAYIDARIAASEE